MRMREGFVLRHYGRSYSILIVSIIILVTGCSSSGDPTNAERLQASIDYNWNVYKAAYSVPNGAGMAVYIESPSGNYFASSGMASSVDQFTRFRIASNTKTFTAAAIMLLYQQGKLQIDDPVNALIPGQGIPYVPATAQYNIPYKSTITIRQLLSHTAGVFDVTNELIPSTAPVLYAGQNYVLYTEAIDPNHQFSPDELVGVDAACQLSYFAPGASYKYSNTGYSILATIIERVSGMTYDQFVTQNLIVPNGLSSTSVPMLATDRSIPTPFNPGYALCQGVMTDVTEDNMSVNIAEGNIISTPADLARWISRLIRGEAGPNTASVQAMMTQTPQSGDSRYGLGIFCVNKLGYGHNGAHMGYISLMMYDPVTDVTVVSYFNLWDETSPYNIRPAQMTLLGQAALDAKTAVGF